MCKKILILIMSIFCCTFSTCNADLESDPMKLHYPENILTTKSPDEIMKNTIVPFKNNQFYLRDSPNGIPGTPFAVTSKFIGDNSIMVLYKFECNAKNQPIYITIFLTENNKDKTFYVDQILRNVIEPKPIVDLKQNDTPIWRKIREALNNSTEVTYVTYPSPNKKNTYYISSKLTKSKKYIILISRISLKGLVEV